MCVQINFSWELHKPLKTYEKCEMNIKEIQKTMVSSYKFNSRELEEVQKVVIGRRRNGTHHRLGYGFFSHLNYQQYRNKT